MCGPEPGRMVRRLLPRAGHAGGGGAVPLTDSYGRTATDLRVSLTDKCNLRCAYCMPAEGLEWLPKPELLTDDELVRLIALAVTRLGITEVRFTGGEALLPGGVGGIIARGAALGPGAEVSLATHRLAPGRAAAPPP